MVYPILDMNNNVVTPTIVLCHRNKHKIGAIYPISEWSITPDMYNKNECSFKVYKEVKTEFEKRGCYFLDKEETEKVRKTIIINGALNAKIVGQKAHTIAELAGVSVPESTKILIGEVKSVELSEEFAHEKLSPVLAMYKAKDFDDAIAKASRLVEDGGLGHTSSL